KLKKKVYIHCITDGRDTPPAVAIDFIKELQKNIKDKNRQSHQP
ncbi:MAG: hypothetical protein JKY09_09510, partial [Crocinitomicaceae bacterium]|nr:hypothetical protein [Crocinitomicaceae bacterium]